MPENGTIKRKTAKKRKRIPVGAALVLMAIGVIAGMLLGIAGKQVVHSLVVSASIRQENGVLTAENGFDAAEKNWNLILVNPWNPLPEEYQVTLARLRNGHAVDQRCYPDLQEMMDDCRAAGLNPLICSSYRSRENQETLFQNKVNRLISQGYSKESAEVEAGKSVAVPGTSEHQLGLAVDIVDVSNQNLDETQEKTAVQKWLMDNSWRYGFILRYPNQKSNVTGIIYEPWHYRYVGTPHALLMEREGLCLEEYLDWVQTAPRTCRLEHGRSARVFYMPCAGDETELRLPEGCCQVSGDNRNGFVVTVWEV